MIMETEKSQKLKSTGWRPRRVDIILAQVGKPKNHKSQ
jgi:hypothetical protein